MGKRDEGRRGGEVAGQEERWGEREGEGDRRVRGGEGADFRFNVVNGRSRSYRNLKDVSN